MTSLNGPRGVSVVIPTIERAAVLLDTIRDLLQQNFDDWEIVVVDQSDDVNDEAIALLKQATVPARYYKADFRGLPQARNFGWRTAGKDIVLFIDDDIRCGPDLVRKHYLAHCSTGAALVAGGITEANQRAVRGRVGAFRWWTATTIPNFDSKTPGWCIHGKGCNFSIRRHAVSAIGGLDERLAVGASLYEETEMALRLRRAGHKAWFAPDAHLLHLAAPAGGCRVQNNWPRYMHGLAHNRSILIFRHLRWWHRPTALLRLLLLGVAYSRVDKSAAPLVATFTGIRAGRKAARLRPLNGELRATECTSS
jgi:GT2 family glycosyltransferase